MDENTHLFYIGNNIATDDLAAQGDTTSTVM